MDRRENVLVFRAIPARGRRTLLCAVGRGTGAAAGSAVLFTTCSLLVQELLVAKRDLKLSGS